MNELGEEYLREDKLLERQIRGWGAVSTAESEGKGSPESSFFFRHG